MPADDTTHGDAPGAPGDLAKLRSERSDSYNAFRGSIADLNRALEQGHAVVYRRNFDEQSYEHMGESVESITGYPAAEMTPDVWDSLIISAELKGPLAGLNLEHANRQIRSGAVDRWQADVEIRHRDGTSRWVVDLSTVLRDSNGHCYGCLGMLQDITERKLAEKDLALTTSALRDRNAEMEDDLALAAELLSALLPVSFPTFPPGVRAEESALRFYWRYQPTGAVGGDFFEVIPLSETKAGVLVCDVMGHGVRAALVAGMIRALMEELSDSADDPGMFLTLINSGLKAILKRAKQPVFTTAFYMVVDAAGDEICYASAGHPGPVHIHRSSGTVELLPAARGRRGAVLGLFEESTYQTMRRVVEMGDAIVMFTDGITEEAGSGDEQYGEERLLSAIKARLDMPLPSLLDGVLGDAEKFAGKKRFSDDVCLVAMEIAGTDVWV